MVTAGHCPAIHPGHGREDRTAQRGSDRHPHPSACCKALGASRASMRLQHHPHEAEPRFSVQSCHLVWSDWPAGNPSCWGPTGGACTILCCVLPPGPSMTQAGPGQCKVICNCCGGFLLRGWCMAWWLEGGGGHRAPRGLSEDCLTLGKSQPVSGAQFPTESTVVSATVRGWDELGRALSALAFGEG